MSFRATGVASTLLGLGAFPTNVTISRTVVTFGTLSAVTRKVSNTATSVASFLAGTATAETAAAAAKTGTGTSAGAVASNVTDFPALVALLTAVPTVPSVPTRGGGSVGLWAVTRNVTFFTTLIASFGF